MQINHTLLALICLFLTSNVASLPILVKRDDPDHPASGQWIQNPDGTFQYPSGWVTNPDANNNAQYVDSPVVQQEQAVTVDTNPADDPNNPANVKIPKLGGPGDGH